MAFVRSFIVFGLKGSVYCCIRVEGVRRGLCESEVFGYSDSLSAHSFLESDSVREVNRCRSCLSPFPELAQFLTAYQPVWRILREFEPWRPAGCVVRTLHELREYISCGEFTGIRSEDPGILHMRIFAHKYSHFVRVKTRAVVQISTRSRCVCFKAL